MEKALSLRINNDIFCPSFSRFYISVTYCYI